jgi:glycosyltransferase involved in cell wall biosynthesis
MRIDVAIFGARMHYAVPRILARANLLGTLYTDAYLGNKPLLRGFLTRLPARYTPPTIRRLLGREEPEISAAQVVSFDVLGLKAVWLRQRTRSSAERPRLHARIARRFGRLVVRAGFPGAGAVYALDGVALEIFRAAKGRGLFTILEQTIAPARIESRLLAEEAERWPGAQIRTKDHRADNPMIPRGEAEWPLADCIVCGSEFVAAGLESLGVERTKCHVVPYGVDTTIFRPRGQRSHTPDLKVLFVGAVGLRKGVPYLLEALRKIEDVRIQCRLIGEIEIQRSWLDKHVGTAQLVGPVPRSEMTSLYDWADVLVLPSICEGSATVTYEALASGLPVITTPNSGSVVRDGKDGFVVPIRDPDAIAARLRQLIEDRELLRSMAANARRRGLEFSLESYGDRLIELIGLTLQSGAHHRMCGARAAASPPVEGAGSCS